MESLFVSRDCKLSVDGAALLVTSEAGKRRVPVKGLNQIVLAGEAGLTSALLTLLARTLLCRYLVHEQKSVFSGVLPRSKLATLRAELARISIPGDRLLFVTAANRHNIDVERLRAADKGLVRAESVLDSTASTVVL